MLHNDAFNKNLFDMKQLKHSQIITQNVTNNDAFNKNLFDIKQLKHSQIITRNVTQLH